MTTIPLARQYVPSVLSGQKVSTVRRGRRAYVPGSCIIESGEHVILATIVKIRHCLLAELTDEDARRDGFASLGELLEALRCFYPAIVSSDEMTVIEFRCEGLADAQG
jgi:cytidine deaminase